MTQPYFDLPIASVKYAVRGDVIRTESGVLGRYVGTSHADVIWIVWGATIGKHQTAYRRCCARFDALMRRQRGES